VGFTSGIVHDAGLKPNTAVAARAPSVALVGVRSGGYPPVRRHCFTNDLSAEYLPHKLAFESFFAVLLLQGVALRHKCPAAVHGFKIDGVVGARRDYACGMLGR